MAEYGVHHATFGRSKPSIFEVIGKESLTDGLRAAFRHMFKILAENHPERFGLLFNYFPEGYTIVDSLFQYAHLRLKGGLFTESFYGMKRIPDPRSLETSKLKIISWVFFAVVHPYLQVQLENIYKSVRENHSQGTLNYKAFKRRVALLYLKLYPIYNFFWEASVLCYYMGYALGKTEFYSPIMHLTSTRLAHVSSLDGSDDAWLDFIPKSEQKNIINVLWNYMNVFITGATATISIGAFFTQFLNWWYNQEGRSTKFTSLPVPPPPQMWPCEIPVDTCAICNKKRTNDTALASSGFVFCYPCIFRFVQENQKCPVTGYKSSLSQLVKLYHQE